MHKGFTQRITMRMLSFVFIGMLSTSAFASLPAIDSQGTPLPSLAPMLKRVTPAVVNIATSGTVRIQGNPLFNDPFFQHFFDTPSQPRERKTQSLGSGVIVDAKKGYIITNNHVIESADEIQVTLRNGEIHQANSVVATDDELAEGFDHATGSVGAFVTIQEHDSGGRDVQRQSQQRRNQ